MKNRQEHYEKNKDKRRRKIKEKDLIELSEVKEVVVRDKKGREFRNKNLKSALKDLATVNNYKVEK